MYRYDRFTAMVTFAVVVVLCIVGFNLCVGLDFSKDGSIEQLKFAQQAVVGNENQASLVAFKFRTSTTILTLSKSKQAKSILGTVHSRNDNMYENAHLRALFVGKRSDCQQARLCCSELDMQHHKVNGISLTAPRLSLCLADVAQQCSMNSQAGRALAYNALVLNTDQASVGFGDMYKVDVSGNFFKCQNTCIGAHSEQIKTWLERQRQRLSSDDQTNFKDSTEDSDAVLTKVFNISAQCLVDNYPISDLAAGNFSVSITVLQEKPSGERVVLGPHPVPEEVLRRLVSLTPGTHDTPAATPSTNADTISTGVGASTQTEHHEVLHRWWKSLHAVNDRNRSGHQSDQGFDSPVWMQHS